MANIMWYYTYAIIRTCAEKSAVAGNGGGFLRNARRKKQI